VSDFKSQISKTSWLALAGGAEFQSGCEEGDRLLVDAASGAGARVAIVPTAAAAEGAPRMAAVNGARHFKRLGADAFGVMIVDQASADDATLAAQLASAQLVYLAGGDPGYLLRCLRGSLAWQTMLAAWRNGAVLAGASAGAMVLCEAMWNPYARRMETALGIVTGAAVIPHHRPGSEWVKILRDALGQRITLVGIAEQTNLIWDGAAWRVAGPGEVTIYSREQTVTHHSGDVFTLEGVNVG
jgi:cyanophycinase